MENFESKLEINEETHWKGTDAIPSWNHGYVNHHHTNYPLTLKAEDISVILESISPVNLKY